MITNDYFCYFNENNLSSVIRQYTCMTIAPGDRIIGSNYRANCVGGSGATSVVYLP